MSSLRRTLFILVVVALLATALAAKNKGKGKKKGKKGNRGKGKGNGNAVVNLSLGKCTANSVDYKVKTFHVAKLNNLSTRYCLGWRVVQRGPLRRVHL